MDFRGQVRKRVWKITFLGLKYGQDLEKQAAHPHQEFLGVPALRDKIMQQFWLPRFYLSQEPRYSFSLLRRIIVNALIWIILIKTLPIIYCIALNLVDCV